MTNALLHKLYSFCIIVCLSCVVYMQYQQEMRMIKIEERMEVLYVSTNNFLQMDSYYKQQREKYLSILIKEMQDDILKLRVKDNSPLPLKKA